MEVATNIGFLCKSSSSLRGERGQTSIIRTNFQSCLLHQKSKSPKGLWRLCCRCLHPDSSGSGAGCSDRRIPAHPGDVQLNG